MQQVVEAALSKLFGGPVKIEGAGRTDSGVHARAQRAHADVPLAIDPRGLRMGVNDLLPHDIRVSSVERVADGFHCRFAAKRKTYVYQIWNDAFADVFAWETHAYVPSPLDEHAMSRAAGALVGEHDFRAFTVLAPEVSSTVRTISAVDVARDGNTIRIGVTANGFLRSMVRRIAGSLIEIGRRRLDEGALQRALEPSFAEARWTAPAKGLTLWDIEY